MAQTDKLLVHIRKLAKNNYWQTIYASSKEMKLQLFENDRNLSYIQILFLNYLSFYSSLYIDIAMGDVEVIVLEDDLYEDSYMYYRNKSRTQQREDMNKKQPGLPSHVNKVTETHKDEWVFRKPDKSKGIIRRGRH